MKKKVKEERSILKARSKSRAVKYILFSAFFIMSVACSNSDKSSEKEEEKENTALSQKAKRISERNLLVNSVLRRSQKMAKKGVDSLDKAYQTGFSEKLRKDESALKKEAKLLSEVFLEYAEKYPADSAAGLYVLKAANIYDEMLQDKNRAIELYGLVYHDFKNFNDYPLAAFLQASAYNDMGRDDKALEILEFYIKEHPDHHMNSQAKAFRKIIESGGIESIIKKKDSVSS